VRAIEGRRQQAGQPKKKPNLGGVFGRTGQRSRPETTLFQVPKRRVTKSKNVTLDQIVESLHCLQEEIAELSANHTEMIGQINAIKSLIQSPVSGATRRSGPQRSGLSSANGSDWHFLTEARHQCQNAAVINVCKLRPI
jgi:TolA-binding protein